MTNPAKIKNLERVMGEVEKRKNKNVLFKLLIKLENFLIKLLHEKRRYHKARILRNKKAIYFLIEKVATNSLKSAFEDYLGKKPFKKNYFGLYKDYFKFAFVRNPYDRLVSCYNDKIFNGRKNEDIILKNNFYVNMPFKEFVKKVFSIPDLRADQHIRSQYYSLTDEKGNLLVDFIGKFENLEKDYKFVCKKIGIKNPKSLPHKNKSKRKNDYRQYYDEEARKIVEKRYKKDLEVFGYEF